jgi:hypothetical protein
VKGVTGRRVNVGVPDAKRLQIVRPQEAAK